MKEAWYIVINPQSGGRRGIRKWEEFSTHLIEMGIPYVHAFTQGPLHATQLVQEAVVDGYRKFATLGGDGTLNESINGLFSQATVDTNELLFTAIPTGTGSDWARMYQLPHNMKTAASLLISHTIFRQDIGKLTCQREEESVVRYFDNIAGLGYDAFVTDKTSHLAKTGIRGQLFYFKALFGGLLQYRPIAMEVKASSFQFSGPVYSANVAICRYNGGGMRPAPLAISNDGLFDITLIKPLTLFQILTNVIRLYTGSLYQHPRVSHHLTEIIEFSSSVPALVEVDGEVAGMLPARFEILPQALRIIVPNTYKQTQR